MHWTTGKDHNYEIPASYFNLLVANISNIDCNQRRQTT